MENQKKAALFSKDLATIRINIPLDLSLNDLKREALKRDEIKKFFSEMGFGSLIKRLEDIID